MIIMKKLFFTILFTFILSAGASAEKIYFDCKTSNGNPNFINYDINNKIFSIVSIKSENPIKTTEWNLTINKVEKDKLTMRSDTFQKYIFFLDNYDFLDVTNRNTIKFNCIKHNPNLVKILGKMNIHTYTEDPSVYNFQDNMYGKSVGPKLKNFFNDVKTNVEVYTFCSGLYASWANRYEENNILNDNYKQHLMFSDLFAKEAKSNLIEVAGFSKDKANEAVNNLVESSKDLLVSTEVDLSLSSRENFWGCNMIKNSMYK
jgi:hypothetical protein